MTSYSPCFRKEVGAHGIEERGIYRVHQFEKQEMVVLCKKEEGMDWYNKMWQYTVELFRSLDIPVRTLECCSGDLADLKVKSCDVEAWSPRQKTYFEVGSCSILGDAQARRLGIRMKTNNGNEYVTTLNNTVLASTRALIALIENNYQEDGSIKAYAAVYHPDDLNAGFEPIETEKEWKVVETILNTIQQEVRQADNIENSNEQE